MHVYSDAMYHSLLSHAKGANSLCMVLVLSLLLICVFKQKQTSSLLKRVACLFYTHSFRTVIGPTPVNVNPFSQGLESLIVYTAHML